MKKKAEIISSTITNPHCKFPLANITGILCFVTFVIVLPNATCQGTIDGFSTKSYIKNNPTPEFDTKQDTSTVFGYPRERPDSSDTESCKMNVVKNCGSDGNCGYRLNFPPLDIMGTFANMLNAGATSPHILMQKCDEISRQINDVEQEQVRLAEENVRALENFTEKINSIERSAVTEVTSLKEIVNDALRSRAMRAEEPSSLDPAYENIHPTQSQSQGFRVLEGRLEVLENMMKTHDESTKANTTTRPTSRESIQAATTSSSMTRQPTARADVTQDGGIPENIYATKRSLFVDDEEDPPQKEVEELLARTREKIEERVSSLEDVLMSVLRGLEDRLSSKIEAVSQEWITRTDTKTSTAQTRTEEWSTEFESTRPITATSSPSSTATSSPSTIATSSPSTTATSSTLSSTTGQPIEEADGPRMMLCKTCCETVSFAEYMRSRAGEFPLLADEVEGRHGNQDRTSITNDPRYVTEEATGGGEIISVIRRIHHNSKTSTNDREYTNRKHDTKSTQIEDTPLNDTMATEGNESEIHKRIIVNSSYSYNSSHDEAAEVNSTLQEWEMTIAPILATATPTSSVHEITIPYSSTYSEEKYTHVTDASEGSGYAATVETNSTYRRASSARISFSNKVNSNPSYSIIEAMMQKQKNTEAMMFDNEGSADASTPSDVMESLTDSSNKLTNLQTSTVAFTSSPAATTSPLGFDLIDLNDAKAELKNIQSKADIPYDCAELYARGERKSGVYRIRPRKRGVWHVYCDMHTAGGGWTTLQRRMNGEINFTRDWEEYQNGFGNPHGEYWLGLDRMHHLTTTNRSRRLTLRIDLTDWEGVSHYAQYDVFRIRGEARNYQLIARKYSGTAGDAFNYGDKYNHNSQPFTTYDRDNDNYGNGNCGEYYRSGWWFNACFAANLNGKYHTRPYRGVQKGIYWGTWYKLTDPITKYRYSFKKVNMKVRPINFNANRRSRST